MTRIGITVSRRVGNAVVRNQVKRWIREATRYELDQVTIVADIVVIAHPSAATAGYLALREQIASAFDEIEGRGARR